MLGLVENIERHTTRSSFQNVGDHILLLSPAGWTSRNDLGGSEYLHKKFGKTAGDAPHFLLHEEVAVQKACLRLIRAGLVESAHDVSDGGLVVSLAEAAMGMGAMISLRRDEGIRVDALLFGEAQSRIVISVKAENVGEIQENLDQFSVQVSRLGEVSNGQFLINIDGRSAVDLSVSEMKHDYDHAISSWMN